MIWGGVFPFLPDSFRSYETSSVFYVSQSVTFCIAYIVSTIGAYYFPHVVRKMLIVVPSAMLILGSSLLILALYTPAIAAILVATSGTLLGIGCTGMFMLWQRYFASLSAQEGGLRLIVGLVIGALLYLALNIMPEVLSTFVITFIFVPLCALTLSECVKRMDLDQPMFQDIPRLHAKVYIYAIKDYWRSAINIGALAFTGGVMKGIVLLDQSLVALANTVLMAGLLISGVVMLVVWYFMKINIKISSLYNFAYLILITCLLGLPFSNSGFTYFFSIVSVIILYLALTLMMMLCAQISRDRGINPLFIYGFFGSIVYTMQSIGFAIGWMAETSGVFGEQHLFPIAMVCTYVLGATLLASNIRNNEQSRLSTRSADALEFYCIRRDKKITEYDQVTCDDCIQAQKDVRQNIHKCQEASCASYHCGIHDSVNSLEKHSNAEGTSNPVASFPKIHESDTKTGDGAIPTVSKQAKFNNKQQIVMANKQSGAAGNKAQDTQRSPREIKHKCTIQYKQNFDDALSAQSIIAKETYELSLRESEVMELIARGRTVSAIAELLFISENTVRTHSKKVYTKMQIHSKNELINLLESINID